MASKGEGMTQLPPDVQAIIQATKLKAAAAALAAAPPVPQPPPPAPIPQSQPHSQPPQSVPHGTHVTPAKLDPEQYAKLCSMLNDLKASGKTSDPRFAKLFQIAQEYATLGPDYESVALSLSIIEKPVFQYGAQTQQNPVPVPTAPTPPAVMASTPSSTAAPNPTAASAAAAAPPSTDTDNTDTPIMIPMYSALI
eukprot:Opistho-2@12409